VWSAADGSARATGPANSPLARSSPSHSPLSFRSRGSSSGRAPTSLTRNGFAGQSISQPSPRTTLAAGETPRSRRDVDDIQTYAGSSHVGSSTSTPTNGLSATARQTQRRSCRLRIRALASANPTVVASNLRELADHICHLPFEAGRAEAGSTRGGNRGGRRPFVPSTIRFSTRCTTCGRPTPNHPAKRTPEDACRQAPGERKKPPQQREGHEEAEVNEDTTTTTQPATKRSRSVASRRFRRHGNRWGASVRVNDPASGESKFVG